MSSLSISSCSDPELYQMFISMQTDSDCFDPVQHVVPGDSQSMSVSDGSSEVYLGEMSVASNNIKPGQYQLGFERLLAAGHSVHLMATAIMWSPVVPRRDNSNCSISCDSH